MQIAEESLISKALSKLQSLFAKLVNMITRKLRKVKPGKVRDRLLALLQRANKGLSKCKSLNKENPEMVKKLQREYEDIEKLYYAYEECDMDADEFDEEE